MLSKEDFDMFFANTVSRDIGRLRNDEFAGAFDLTQAANKGFADRSLPVFV